MNPEIHEIVSDMKRRCKENPIAESDKQTHLMVQFSRLSVLFAEETEAQNKTITHLTEKTVNLTKSINVLTWVMVAVGIVQLSVAFIKS